MELKYRPEIDGLRTIAVLSVIIYHAEFVLGGKTLLPGGFLGVDVFFVISGFLITSLILSEIQRTGTLSLTNFYERRARRLLPALFVVLLATIPFALKTLLPAQMLDYAKSMVSSIFFGSNFYWNYSLQQYGAESGLLKPLLHTWSLAVEEQYYIVFPLILMCAYRWFKNHILTLLVIAFLISLQFAEWMSPRSASFSFYMLPSRLWELLAGGILATQVYTTPQKPKNPILAATMPSLGIYLIVYSLVFVDLEKNRHPGFITLIPVIGSALVIYYANSKELITKILSSKPFVSIGLISYSLYLWHYPIFAFTRIKDQSRSNFDMLELCLATFLLATLTYFFIEKPFRNRKKVSFKLLFVLILSSYIGFSAFCYIVYKTDGTFGRYTEGQLKFLNMDRNLGGDFTKYVTTAYKSQAQRANYRQNGLPKLLIIGDSYSQDFYNILKESGRLQSVDAIAHYISKRCHNVPHDTEDLLSKMTTENQKPCNKAVRVGSAQLSDRLKQADAVVFASSWNTYTISQMSNLIATTKAHGVKNTLIIGRKLFGTLKTSTLLEMPLNQLLLHRTKPRASYIETNSMMREIAGEDYLDFYDLLCSRDRGCPLSTPDGFLISYDGSHLTEEGAKFVGSKLNNSTNFANFWNSLQTSNQGME